MKHQGLLIGIFLALLTFIQVWLSTHFYFRVSSEIATYSWLVSQGQLPFRDFWDMHPPGLFFILGSIMKIIPDPGAVIKFVFLAILILDTYLFFLLTWRVTGKLVTAYAATFVFVPLQFVWSRNMLWTTTYPLPFLIAALLCFVLFIQSRKKKYFLWSSFLFGLAALTKHQTPLYLAVFLLLYCQTQRRLAQRFWTTLRECVVAVILAGVPTAVLLGYYYVQGALSDYWYNVYVASYHISRIWGLAHGTPISPYEISLMIPLAVGLLFILKGSQFVQKESFYAISAFYLVSLIFHYPYPATAYALFASPVVALMSVELWMERKRSLQLLVLLVWLPFVLAVGSRVFSLYNRPSFGTEPSKSVVTEWIKTNTHPREKIYKYCSEPYVYYSAQRLPAVYYLHMDFLLTKRADLYPGQDRTIRDLEKEKPRIVVYDEQDADISSWNDTTKLTAYNQGQCSAVYAYILTHYQEKVRLSQSATIWERI